MNHAYIAAFWGGMAGFALLLGALIGYHAKLNQRQAAGIMAFGSGALISACTFDIVEDAYRLGGIASTVLGFMLGSVIYSLSNALLAKSGVKHRKRSNLRKRLKMEHTFENAKAIALGALIDGIPESIVIGLSILTQGSVSLITVAAVFISNIPEALSSSAGMKQYGKKAGFIFSIWGSVFAISAIGAALGYILMRDMPASVSATLTAVAGGAMLTMIVDTMIPEAFEETHNYAGLLTSVGFLLMFLLSKL